ncbi:hypothetical protein WME75_09565 [Sorangium sp. So ce1014]|uniref:hypothetical protein n=1 Tax=Sorangium sp. So ce1014 TaxID=3133326 RepID=UPI003F5FEA42
MKPSPWDRLNHDGSPSRPPHPATLAQPMALPPHPATAMQPKALPPHPATVVQPKALHPARVPGRTLRTSGTVQPMEDSGPQRGHALYESMLRTEKGKDLHKEADSACPYGGYGINFSDRPTQTLGTNINICVADGSPTDILYDIVQELWNMANRAKFRALREHPPQHEGRPDGLQHAVNMELLERGAVRIYKAIAAQLKLPLNVFVQRTDGMTSWDYINYMAEFNREHLLQYAREVNKNFDQEVRNWSGEDK